MTPQQKADSLEMSFMTPIYVSITRVFYRRKAQSIACELAVIHVNFLLELPEMRKDHRLDELNTTYWSEVIEILLARKNHYESQTGK